jgi:parallel beta-helix repeat protein
MKKRRTLEALLAAVALLSTIAPGALAAKPIHLSCGDTITADTKLADDLLDCPGIGVIVGADDVTLDLGGHTIDGDGVGDFEGVQNIGHDRVTIQHGSIRDFVEGVAVLSARDNRLRDLALSDHRHTGIFVSDSTDVQVRRTSSADIAFAGIFLTRSHDIRVEDNVVTSSGGGIAARLSDQLQITRNTAAGNENEGVLLFDETRHARVEHNAVSGNAAGIVVVADDNRVSHNRVADNGDNIVVAGNDNTISDNEVVDAVGFPDDPVGGFGILIDGGDDNLLRANAVAGAASNGIRVVAFDPDATGPAERNVIRANRVERARLDGILVDETTTGSLLERNHAERAGDDGIDVESAATTLIANSAVRNADLGIEAVAGVTDGGGNRAAANGNPLGCTNVSC